MTPVILLPDPSVETMPYVILKCYAIRHTATEGSALDVNRKGAKTREKDRLLVLEWLQGLRAYDFLITSSTFL